MRDNDKEIFYLIGRNLKRIRKEKKMSVEELASKSTYSVGFIMNIESDSYLQTFSLGTLWRFAKVLGVDIKEFFND